MQSAAAPAERHWDREWDWEWDCGETGGVDSATTRVGADGTWGWGGTTAGRARTGICDFHYLYTEWAGDSATARDAAEGAAGICSDAAAGDATATATAGNAAGGSTAEGGVPVAPEQGMPQTAVQAVARSAGL